MAILVNWKKSPAAPLVHWTWRTVASSPPAKGAAFAVCLVPVQAPYKSGRHLGSNCGCDGGIAGAMNRLPPNRHSPAFGSPE